MTPDEARAAAHARILADPERAIQLAHFVGRYKTRHTRYPARTNAQAWADFAAGQAAEETRQERNR